jgi:hypothetical protein
MDGRKVDREKAERLGHNVFLACRRVSSRRESGGLVRRRTGEVVARASTR